MHNVPLPSTWDLPYNVTKPHWHPVFYSKLPSIFSYLFQGVNNLALSLITASYQVFRSIWSPKRTKEACSLLCSFSSSFLWHERFHLRNFVLLPCTNWEFPTINRWPFWFWHFGIFLTKVLRAVFFCHVVTMSFLLFLKVEVQIVLLKDSNPQEGEFFPNKISALQSNCVIMEIKPFIIIFWRKKQKIRIWNELNLN